MLARQTSQDAELFTYSTPLRLAISPTARYVVHWFVHDEVEAILRRIGISPHMLAVSLMKLSC